MDAKRDEFRHDQLVEELRLLLDVAAGKAEEYLRGCVQRVEGSECGWCPLCAGVAMLRGHRPELNDQLVGIVQALRKLLADQSPESREAGEPEASADDAPASKVQRIRVERVGGPVLSDETEAVSRC